MSKRKSSGWSMPLMEMIIAVCFFILCASVCIRVFVKAENLSRLADDTNYSVMMSQCIAETIKAKGIDGLSDLGAEVIEDGHYQVMESDGFQADIVVLEKDMMLQADIAVSKDQKVLYELGVSRYMGAAMKKAGGGR